LTLILAQASRLFSLQVSDRLVTRGNTSFDAMSNKNVLFIARDAIMAFGYTGLAYLEGVSTDQWIAETLIGKKFDRQRRPPSLSMGIGLALSTHIGPAIQRLDAGLRAVFSADRRADARTAMFEILGAGWQWDRAGRPRPILIGLRKNAGSLDINVWRSPRHIGRDFIFAATPEGNLSDSEVAATRVAAKGVRSYDDAERVMVEAIRRVSERLPCVGSNCMSILIPPPTLGWVRIRYIPVSPASLAIQSRYDGTVRAVAPAAFSPWVVSSGLVHAPSALTGQMTLQVDNFNIYLEAPEPGGGSLIGAIGSIERPPEPR
jgi:hypothetical protein